MALIELVTEPVAAKTSTAAPAGGGDGAPRRWPRPSPASPASAGERRLAGQPGSRRDSADESPAEELVEGTEERDEAVSDQEAPSDDSSAEEAGAAGRS